MALKNTVNKCIKLKLSLMEILQISVLYFLVNLEKEHKIWPKHKNYKYTLCPKKNIPDIFNCNLKTNYRILIIFGRNIPDATCHQMNI